MKKFYKKPSVALVGRNQQTKNRMLKKIILFSMHVFIGSYAIAFIQGVPCMQMLILLLIALSNTLMMMLAIEQIEICSCSTFKWGAAILRLPDGKQVHQLIKKE